MSRKFLYASLVLNALFIVLTVIVLNKLGGIKYVLIRLERAHNGIEYEDMVSQFKVLPDKENEIIFLGNSMTFRGQWAELFNNRCINRGIGGDDSDRILHRLDEIINRKPAKIFMMIGINDLGKNRSNEYIINNYRQVIQTFQKRTPATQLYVQSVLPVNNEIKNQRRSNADIKSLNGEIMKLSMECHVTYVDLSSKFIDNKGQLKDELTTDGIHINGDGYLVWRNIIYDYVMR